MYIIRETTERESDGLELSSRETIIYTHNVLDVEGFIDDVFAMYAADLANEYRKEAMAIGYANMRKMYCVYLIECDLYNDPKHGLVIDFAKYDSHDFMDGEK